MRPWPPVWELASHVHAAAYCCWLHWRVYLCSVARGVQPALKHSVRKGARVLPPAAAILQPMTAQQQDTVVV